MSDARQHECQLPAEVPRILDPGIHPLTANGTVDVAGITCKEHGACPIAACLAMMQSEVGQPFWIMQAYDTARGPIDDTLQFLEREFSGHWLVAVICSPSVCGCLLDGHRNDTPCGRPTQRKEQRNAARCDKGVKDIPLQPNCRTGVRFDVSKHEILKIGLSFERYAGFLAYRTVRAIASDKISRRQLLFSAVEISQDALHGIGLHLEANQIDAAFDDHAFGLEVLSK
jgi:hypothetical protein